MFLNLKNGVLTENEYRFPDATLTDEDDIRKEYEDGSEECLTASITD